MMSKEVRVKFIADPLEQKAREKASIHGATVATAEAIIADPEIDIVDICLPTYKHKEYVLKAATSGKHVFCEKPIALTLPDAIEMTEFCKKSGVCFMVGHVVRFFPEYKKIFEIKERGDIGKIVMARLYRGGSYPSHGIDNWFDDEKKSGGMFVDLSIHDFDFLRVLFGEVYSVHAKSAKLNTPQCRKNYDHGMAIVRFKNDLIAHIEGSWAEPSGSPVGFGTTYEIIGTEGMLVFNFEESATLRMQCTNDSSVEFLKTAPSVINPYYEELKSFVNSVRNHLPVSVSGTDASEALKIALAANQSARSQRTVTLSEVV
jgi:predicted dehydrogenase